MGIVYKVTVERLEYGSTGDLGVIETLFEAASPNAERLLGYAPGEVEATLIEAAMRAEADKFPQRVTQGPKGEDFDGLCADAAVSFQAMNALPQDDEPAPADVEEKPKRRRRTKAEIEADKAAAERVSSAVLAPADATPPTDPVDAPATDAPQAAEAGYTTPDGPVVTESASAGEEAPAAPWNPFAK